MWEKTTIGLGASSYIGSIHTMDFSLNAKKAGKVLYYRTYEVVYEDSKINLDIYKYVKELGFKEVFVGFDNKFAIPASDTRYRYTETYNHSGNPKGEDGGVYKVVYLRDNALIELENTNESLVIYVITTNKRLMENIHRTMKPAITKREKKPTGNVHSLMMNGPELQIKNLGITSLDYEKENYDPRVIEDIDHATSDLASSSPCGRLVLINGIPGSGKTSLIRMLTKVVNRTFIYVPSNQLMDWSGPSLINLLNESRDSNLFPIVFIIEDADDCLVPRKETSNVNAISALLNLSDGILGSVFDIRIIATTNATISEYDPAVVRDGRLCRRIDINDLQAEQANQIYKRISGKDESPFKIPMTLASIYKYAKDPNELIKMEKAQQKRIGFV